MKVFVVLIVAILTTACSAEKIYVFPFADLDAGRSDAIPRTVRDCDPLHPETIYHCGACDRPCDTANADSCVVGVCQCGINPPCGGGEDCRGGRCIANDPEGDICEFDDWCVAGYACIESNCSFVECTPEVCDGADNDCDGVVDNNGAGPLSEYCPVGVDPSRLLPPCQSGFRTCSSGRWTECVGEVPPVPEVGLLGCDGVDNDCDGCTDGVYSSGVCLSSAPAAFDVVFYIDQSGSMFSKIAVVRDAVRLFSTRLSANPLFRWGIVLIPSTARDGVSEVRFDLGSFADFLAVLDSLISTSGGSEPQWDAIYETTTGELPVSWRDGATRILILFTDEVGQTSRVARGLSPVSEAIMCSVLTRGEVFVPVISLSYTHSFDLCAHTIFPLRTGASSSRDACTTDRNCVSPEVCRVAECVSVEAVTVADDLSSVIADPCGA